jgi:serine/threonine protein kinase
MALADGAEFAGFRIVRLIGVGGMGEVYLAEHPRLPRQDALKILARDLSTSGEFHERFIREADLAAKLFHPSIVGVHDRGDYDGQLWIAMDYVDGPDAAKLLRQRYPAGMPVEEVIAIIDPVASALDYAHRSGLLHRDVKPANILLAAPEEDGQRVFLADFGISRQVGEISGLTATNLTLGTVAYCAPEQLMGGHIDGRADQYALGATAFHLLTGTQPYEGTNPVAVISNHLNAAIPRISDRRPDLAALDPVFAKVLAKQPENRFISCREFASALRQATSAHIIDAARAAADPTMAASTFAAAPTRPVAAPDRPTQAAPPPTTRPETPPRSPVGIPAPSTGNWFGKLSPTVQTLVSAVFALMSVSIPFMFRGSLVTLFVPFVCFLGVLAVVARSPRRRSRALLVAGITGAIVVAISLLEIYGYPRPRDKFLIVASGLTFLFPLGFVAAWSVARRNHAGCWIGILLAAPLTAGVQFLLDGNLPVLPSLNLLAAWGIPTALGCAVAWCVDLAARRTRRSLDKLTTMPPPPPSS